MNYYDQAAKVIREYALSKYKDELIEVAEFLEKMPVKLSFEQDGSNSVAISVPVYLVGELVGHATMFVSAISEEDPEIVVDSRFDLWIDQ
jgi:hypothetical protein